MRGGNINLVIELATYNSHLTKFQNTNNIVSIISQPTEQDGVNMPCNAAHALRLDEDKLTTLNEHQMNAHGRHKCCQCAYNQGYAQGAQLSENIALNINALGNSQAGRDGRHKSVHQAFALGYFDGINNFIDNH